MDQGDDSDPSSDADNPPEPAIDVVDQTALADPPDVAWLRDRLTAALGRVDHPIGRITVSIVGDARMQNLNKTHRQVAETTDVLAFELTEDPLEVDIVVCIDEARRRVAELKHPVERELLLYALHGVFHCVGFDDNTSEDAAAMHAEEDRILTTIGVGPTFDVQEPSRHEGGSARGRGS